MILEDMYVIFSVRPFHRNIARTILKAPKYYFYDTGQVIGDIGIKLENATACALLKEAHYLEDCYGEEVKLHYLMTKDGREIDFFVVRNDVPLLMAEVKWADGSPSSNFSIFEKYFPGVKKVQIVGKLDREKTYLDGTEIRAAHHWLSEFSLL
jgi:predicted AAA+ superfamily ATPase